MRHAGYYLITTSQNSAACVTCAVLVGPLRSCVPASFLLVSEFGERGRERRKTEEGASEKLLGKIDIPIDPDISLGRENMTLLQIS